MLKFATPLKGLPVAVYRRNVCVCIRRACIHLVQSLNRSYKIKQFFCVQRLYFIQHFTEHVRFEIFFFLFYTPRTARRRRHNQDLVHTPFLATWYCSLQLIRHFSVHNVFISVRYQAAIHHNIRKCV